MNIVKRVISLTLAFVVILSLNVPVSAHDNSRLSIKFKEFQLFIDDYNPSDVYVKYDKSGLEEKALIIYKRTGQIAEKISLQALGNRSADVYPYTLTRSVSYGDTTVEVNMNVEIYSKGSFRQINAYEGGYLGIGTSVTDSYLEGSNLNVWSPNGFPTTELYYAFNTTIVAVVDISDSGSIQASLAGSGFSVSHTVGGKKYYRLSANSTGIVSLYN